LLNGQDIRRARELLESAQVGDVRLRSQLVAAVRCDLATSPTGAAYRFHLERAVDELDRRLSQRALVLAVFDRELRELAVA
jgi:hypothetical protein